jgi:hypothetical protein
METRNEERRSKVRLNSFIDTTRDAEREKTVNWGRREDRDWEKIVPGRREDRAREKRRSWLGEDRARKKRRACVGRRQDQVQGEA